MGGETLWESSSPHPHCHFQSTKGLDTPAEPRPSLSASSLLYSRRAFLVPFPPILNFALILDFPLQVPTQVTPQPELAWVGRCARWGRGG